MKLPFTTEQFLEVFRRYNNSVFPLQALFLILAGYIIYLLLNNNQKNSIWISIILSLFWLWMGIGYHIAFFSVINKAAYIFGSLFIMQGMIFLIWGFKRNIAFSMSGNIQGFVSVALIIYSLIAYPLIGYLTGHGYPYSPTFGLPCPTTIFTMAVLITSQQRLPFYIIIIPMIWSVIGTSAAFTLGIYEDIALIVSSLLLILRNSLHYKVSIVKLLQMKRIAYNSALFTAITGSITFITAILTPPLIQ